MKIDVNRKFVLKSVVVVALAFLVAFAGFAVGVTMTYPVAEKKGFKTGYLQALADVSDKTGLTFEWEDLGNGRYKIVAYYEGGLVAEGVAEVHLWIVHTRNGKVLSSEFGAGTLTTIGKNWIEQQLAESDGTQEALYCADSNDAGAPDVGWTELPTEIAANGLDRQDGSYASTGDGTWNVTVTKSVTGTQSTQLWGLHWVTTDESDNNLLAADSGPAQKNCVDGDSLKETWQIEVT